MKLQFEAWHLIRFARTPALKLIIDRCWNKYSQERVGTTRNYIPPHPRYMPETKEKNLNPLRYFINQAVLEIRERENRNLSEKLPFDMNKYDSNGCEKWE